MRYLLLATLLIAGCEVAEDPAVTLNIDKNKVTTSGVSAGAHMAHQLHIAYSDIFSGVGIVSGGPYNCANNSLGTAMGRCMANTDKPLPITDFAAVIRAEDKLRTFLAERLARYKLPRSIIVLDTLPLTAIGKLDKKLLETREVPK